MEQTTKEIMRQNAREQLTHDRRIRAMEMRRAKKKHKDMTGWILEFSKKVVVMLVLIHLATYIAAFVTMWKFFDLSALPNLIDNSARLMEVCVFGYMIKAGIENWQKIKRGSIRNDEEQEEAQG